MPLYKRTLTSSISPTGFSSVGSKPSPSREGQFTFSNSPNNTGANQFSYLICERNTQGSQFGQNLTTGYLCVDLNNEYYQQAWFIKNDIIAVGENIDGTHTEYFNSQINSFVFSEANASFQIIESEIQVKNKTQPEFNSKVYTTESGIKYEFIDSDSTKMKWTSKIEIIQNISPEIPIPFSFSAVQAQISNGTSPPDAVFDQGSNKAIVIEAGEDDGTSNNSNVIEAGID